MARPTPTQNPNPTYRPLQDPKSLPMQKKLPAPTSNIRPLMPNKTKGMRMAMPRIPMFKKGGKVKSTGPAILHKGERVLNTKQTKKYDSAKAKKTKISNAASKLMGGLYSK
jgi:hypothetical protein